MINLAKVLTRSGMVISGDTIKFKLLIRTIGLEYQYSPDDKSKRVELGKLYIFSRNRRNFTPLTK